MPIPMNRPYRAACLGGDAVTQAFGLGCMNRAFSPQKQPDTMFPCFRLNTYEKRTARGSRIVSRGRRLYIPSAAAALATCRGNGHSGFLR